MRLKSFFTILLATFSIAGADAQVPDGTLLTKELRSKDPVFYSNASMYVAPNTTDGKDAVMFISGSATFSDTAQIVQQGITALTGDFISTKYRENYSTKLKSLFVTPDAVNGAIRFMGQWNSQSILRGTATQSTSSDGWALMDRKALYPEYVLNFPRIEVRKEGFKELTDLLPKKGYYLPYQPGDQFVYYRSIDYGVLHVATNVAISVEKLDVTGGNRFTVDVSSDGLDPYGALLFSDPLDFNAPDYYKLNSGFADIRGVVEENPTAKLLGGYHEVDMTSLYDYNPGMNGLHSTDKNLSQAQEDDQVIKTNTINIAGFNNATFMRGFTSPFDKLRTDYMFYHVLTAPTATSITGGKGPLGEPDMLFNPGQGYFQAMDVSAAYFEKIDQVWTTDYMERNRGGYNLSRLAQEFHDRNTDKHPVTGDEMFLNTRKNLSLFSISDADAQVAPLEGVIRPVEEQRFNTGDVEVNLYAVKTGAGGSPGLNFLANPYMTPISINDILVDMSNGGDLASAFDELQTAGNQKLITPFSIGAVGGNNVKAVHKLDASAIADANANNYALIRSAFWLVNSAFVANTKHNGNPAYAYNVKYDFVDLATSATTIDKVNNRFIEPMQMFLLQVAREGKFVFNNGMKAKQGERFPTLIGTGEFEPTSPIPAASRSARTENVEENELVIPDWFVVEAVAGENNITVDRTAVRFFETASLGYDSHHDQFKNLTQPKVALTSRSSSRIGEIGEEVAPKNVVYTSTSQNEPLLANCINYETKEIPLSYIAGDKEQNVTFTVQGLEGFTADKGSIRGVWLIDKENDNYKQDLLQDNQYTFVSKPVDKPLEADSRFILRFYDGDDEGPEGPSVTEKPITCYYSGSTLHIGGLNEKDLGSVVQIFDLQGRMMGNTTVTRHPSMEYQKTLGQGTFIVKITGDRNYTTKFVNIQNY